MTPWHNETVEPTVIADDYQRWESWLWKELGDEAAADVTALDVGTKAILYDLMARLAAKDLPGAGAEPTASGPCDPDAGRRNRKGVGQRLEAGTGPTEAEQGRSIPPTGADVVRPSCSCKTEGPQGPVWCTACGHDCKCCTCRD